ncbi:hypothetical protein SARC_17696, partial [Sphaeroforma arctica JP610]
AELLELAGAAYKLLIPIYEHMRAFDFLHVAYGHLSEVYRDVINVVGRLHGQPVSYSRL